MKQLQRSFQFEEAELGTGNPVIGYSKLFRDSTAVRLHYHQSLEINICRNVSGKAWLGKVCADLSRDPVLIIPPNHSHWYDIEKSSGYITVVHIHIPTVTEVLAQSIISSMLFTHSHLIYAHHPIYHELLQEIMYVFSRPLKQNAGGILLLRLLDLLSDGNTKIQTSVELRSSRAVQCAVSYIEHNYANSITLKDVASAAGYERSYFCRVFHASTGMRVNEFMHAVRTEHSISFLQNGYRVGETAYLVGYDAPSYFIKQFRRRYSMTPGEYIRSQEW